MSGTATTASTTDTLLNDTFFAFLSAVITTNEGIVMNSELERMRTFSLGLMTFLGELL
jgi:hypothetical protein